MASAQWLLNDTSVTNGSYWTAESGSSYKLKNINGGTLSRITSSPTPYEGAGFYRANTTSSLWEFDYTSNSPVTGGTYYFDCYIYTRSSPADDAQVMQTNQSFFLEYSWVSILSNGKLAISTYDTVNGVLERTATATGTCPDDEWFRVQVKATAAGITEAKLFKGTGINGTTPDNTLTFAAAYVSFDQLIGAGFDTNGGAAFDDIKFDDTAYPTRGGTAHTASGTSTITATGTASMSNARVGAGSSTETATGTAAASNQRTLEGSASVTASATAEMSSTQVIGASGTGTASGTADAAVTALVTISGAGSATASATAGASSTQVFAGSATVTATGITEAIKTVNIDASALNIASATSTALRAVDIDASAIVTSTALSTATNAKSIDASAIITVSTTANILYASTITGSSAITAVATVSASTYNALENYYVTFGIMESTWAMGPIESAWSIGPMM